MRRNVPRVGAAYAIGAWLIVEVSSVVLPAFEAPDWLLRLVIVLALLGLPIALAGAWAFELTAEGLKRDEAVDRTEKLMRRPSPGRYAIASMIPWPLPEVSRSSESSRRRYQVRTEDRSRSYPSRT